MTTATITRPRAGVYTIRESDGTDMVIFEVVWNDLMYREVSTFDDGVLDVTECFFEIFQYRGSLRTNQYLRFGYTKVFSGFVSERGLSRDGWDFESGLRFMKNYAGDLVDIAKVSDMGSAVLFDSIGILTESNYSLD